MPWNLVFPVGTDIVSQAPPLFQQNWAFLQNSIGTDHFFNTGAPTEGHHKFSQYGNQVVAPVPAVDSVLYSQLTTLGLTGSSQLFLANSTNTRQVATFLGGTTVTPAGTTTIFTGNVLQPFFGWLHVVNGSVPSDYGVAFIYWNTSGTITVRQLFVNGSITAIAGTGPNIRVTTSANITVVWGMYTIPF